MEIKYKTANWSAPFIIYWRRIDEKGTLCADINRKVNKLIDDMKSEVGLITKMKSPTYGNCITNVAFEFGYTLDKGHQDSVALIPLLFKGDFATSFPPNILKETLIRDLRDDSKYIDTLFGLSNPMGVVPAMIPELVGNSEYKQLLASLRGEKDDPKDEVMDHEFMSAHGEAVVSLSIAPTDFVKGKEIGGGGYGRCV